MVSKRNNIGLIKILRLISFVIFFSVLFYHSSYCQGIISGIVTDSLTRTPLIGANVYLVGMALGNSTDLEGKYIISKIPLNSYKLRISCVGYKPKEIARTLGTTPNTVRVTLSNLKKEKNKMASPKSRAIS